MSNDQSMFICLIIYCLYVHKWNFVTFCPNMFVVKMTADSPLKLSYFKVNKFLGLRSERKYATYVSNPYACMWIELELRSFNHLLFIARTLKHKQTVVSRENIQTDR